MRAWRGAIGGLAIAICVAANRSEGAPVTWQLSGSVQGVLTCCGSPAIPVSDPALSSLGVAPGVPFSATIVIEPTTPDADASPDGGTYLGGVLSMRFAAGSYQAIVGNPVEIGDLVVNVPFQAMILLEGGPGRANLFTNPLLAFDVLADVPATFASDAMPIEPLPLANLHPYDPQDPVFGFGTSFEVLGDGTSTTIQIQSAITSWARVPEPTLAVLVVTAFGGLLFGFRLKAAAA